MYHALLFHCSEVWYYNKRCDFHCSDSADKVVQGQGKFEEIVVASNEITASTVQLVAASRVKARQTSAGLAGLQGASRNVVESAAGVVASAKTGAEMIEDSKAVPDYSKLTLTQAKRYEMESQVCESFYNSTLLILLTKCIESPTWQCSSFLTRSVSFFKVITPEDDCLKMDNAVKNNYDLFKLRCREPWKKLYVFFSGLLK